DEALAQALGDGLRSKATRRPDGQVCDNVKILQVSILCCTSRLLSYPMRQQARDPLLNSNNHHTQRLHRPWFFGMYPLLRVLVPLVHILAAQEFLSVV